eukprot:SAG11_NODE_13_length_26388_cov_67.360341_18_plen_56_part_00
MLAMYLFFNRIPWLLCNTIDNMHNMSDRNFMMGVFGTISVFRPISWYSARSLSLD